MGKAGLSDTRGIRRLIDHLPLEHRMRAAGLAAGTVTLAGGILGTGCSAPIDQEEPPRPPAASDSSSNHRVDIIDEGPPPSTTITVRIPAPETVVRTKLGELSVASTVDDLMIGPPATAADLVDALLDPSSKTAAQERQLALTQWFENADLPTEGDVDLDLAAYERLAEVLDDSNIRPSRAGLTLYAHRRGLAVPGSEPDAAFVIDVLHSVAGPQFSLSVTEPPSELSVAGLRFLERLGPEAAERLLASWNVQATPNSIVLSEEQAEELMALAFVRGVDVQGDLQGLGKLQFVGERPEDPNERFGWYERIVESQGFVFRSDPGAMNIVGLRGFDPEYGAHENRFNEWNDSIAFVWTDDAGARHVEEFRATTDPGMARTYDAPDADGDGQSDVAHLSPGQYIYASGTHKGRPGAGNPTLNVPVDRDTNHDGAISDAERQASRARGDVGYGINIHWGPGNEGGAVNGYSLGCQVLTLNYAQFTERVSPHLRANDEIPYTLVEMNDLMESERLLTALG